MAADGLGIEEALKRGVFCPLGDGDADIVGAMAALRDIGYVGWAVVEQDQSLTNADTRESLVAGQRRNFQYLRRLEA